jgi:hypothetical protein
MPPHRTRHPPGSAKLTVALSLPLMLSLALILVLSLSPVPVTAAGIVTATVAPGILE